MNDRDRQNRYDRNPREGAYDRDYRGAAPRQQNQFAEGVRQQGSGGLDNRGQMGGTYEDYRGRTGGAYEGAYLPPHQLQEDRLREDQRRAADSYRAERDRRYDREAGRGYEIPTYNADYGNRYASFTSEDQGGRDFYARQGGGYGGASSGLGYRPSYDTFGRRRYAEEDRGAHGRRDYDDWRSYGERRGFIDRASDEVASWFGDEDAARRREMDHSGRGPANYTRSDERIREDVNDHLTRDWAIDARPISVSVSEGEVTLDGTVDSRRAKRRAEDITDDVAGVRHVQNNLRVKNVREGTPSMPESGLGASAAISDRKNANTDR
ncbi:BON domain-containing protein [Novosphingobium sp. PC22D]|uniref:BON domain-containing protein n=1 Tax=Novosphingobium sp. PC22D TaxID=1962403 RepID=UPI001F0B0BB3|nr:BON domain-containing protein [Novosphingobium sp. PC22D]